MSLYGMVMGQDPNSPMLVDLLSARQRIDPGRFRDAWVEAEGDQVVIRVHTRNGGGNREDQAGAIQTMVDHPWYLRDEDDSYDSTYADFYFAVDLLWVAEFGNEAGDSVGDRLVEGLVHVARPHVDMEARWKAAIKGFEEGVAEAREPGPAVPEPQQEGPIPGDEDALDDTGAPALDPGEPQE